MSKVGGIVAILAGIVSGVITAAAVVVLSEGVPYQGGPMSRLDVVIGWGSVLLSFLVIVLGAISLKRPRRAGIALILASILGAILGGTLIPRFGVIVDVTFIACMFLSLYGGVLAAVGAKKADTPSIH